MKSLLCYCEQFLHKKLHASTREMCAVLLHTAPYDRVISEEESNQPVYKYVGKYHKRFKRVHVCGFTVTGALGVPELPYPENKLRNRPIFSQGYPYRLMLDKIDHVACGYGYSVFASQHMDSLKVWGCGINVDSQMGFHRGGKKKNIDSDRESYRYIMEPSPIHLPLKDARTARVIDIACGRAHTLILTDTEGVFTIGNNAFGQCGRPIIDGEVYENSSKVHNIPHEKFRSPVSKVVCGMDHSLFLTENGEVYGCGWGADGQNGLGSFEATGEPTLLKGELEGVEIMQLSSFADTTLAVSKDNQIYAWGSSEYGQLTCVSDSTQVLAPTRLPFTKPKGIVQVAAGGTTCMLLTDAGEVWVWGYGILGKGPNLDSSMWPRKVPLTLFGLSDFRKNIYVTKIRCGLGNFAAITNIGELYTWGKNRKGCLGIGSFRNQFFPWKVILGSEVLDVACGVDHMIILSKSLL